MVFSQMIHNIPQPDFEQLITKKLANSSNVEIRKNNTFVSVEQVSISADSCLYALCL